MALREHRLASRGTDVEILADVAPPFGLSGKRLFDIAGAAIALTLLAPLFVIIVVSIKLESGGPIFSRKTVYGYKDRAVSIFRFRSLTARDERNRDFCLTWVGRVLLRTGLDQLPKLFNVLLGDMTIVGPRPYSCPQDLLGYWIAPLLDGVRPGLTSWSHKGSVTIEQRIDDDLCYVKNWSLLLDIKIILMTVIR